MLVLEHCSVLLGNQCTQHCPVPCLLNKHCQKCLVSISAAISVDCIESRTLSDNQLSKEREEQKKQKRKRRTESNHNKNDNG